MKIVLDTNVLISALINPNGKPAEILNLIINGRIDFLIDNRILVEYGNVLHRKKFKFSEEQINPLLDFIKHEGKFISADPIATDFSDPDDKKFYEVALTGNASYLVTGNQIHFPKVNWIVNPAEFLIMYHNESK